MRGAVRELLARAPVKLVEACRELTQLPAALATTPDLRPALGAGRGRVSPSNFRRRPMVPASAARDTAADRATPPVKVRSRQLICKTRQGSVATGHERDVTSDDKLLSSALCSFRRRPRDSRIKPTDGVATIGGEIAGGVFGCSVN
jgi:hypothetical protein